MISTRDASVKWVQVTSCHASLRHQPVHPSASLIHQHAMAGAHGSRSRDGCSNCRRRKRRCDESKPVCLTCRRTGADCIYPVPGSASNPLKFVVATSPHYILPSPGAGKSRFLHLSSTEMPALCLPGETSINQPDGPRLDMGFPRQISLFQGTGQRALRAVEPALMQYCKRPLLCLVI